MFGRAGKALSCALYVHKSIYKRSFMQQCMYGSSSSSSSSSRVYSMTPMISYHLSPIIPSSPLFTHSFLPSLHAPLDPSPPHSSLPQVDTQRDTYAILHHFTTEILYKGWDPHPLEWNREDTPSPLPNTPEHEEMNAREHKAVALASLSLKVCQVYWEMATKTLLTNGQGLFQFDPLRRQWKKSPK